MSEFETTTPTPATEAEVKPVTPEEVKAARPARKIPAVWWGLAAGLLAAAAVTAFWFFCEAGLISLVFGVFTYCFVANLCLWDDSAVSDVILWFGERSIQFPGLIGEFSFDGFMWLIGMKLLFWVVGALFGLVCTLFGVFVGWLISPFAYGFALHSYLEDR